MLILPADIKRLLVEAPIGNTISLEVTLVCVKSSGVITIVEYPQMVESARLFSVSHGKVAGVVGDGSVVKDVMLEGSELSV